MKKIIEIVIICVFCVLVLSSCAKKNTVDSEKVIRISTPYAEICVPENFAGNMKNNVVSETPYTLEFTTIEDNTKIFSLVFGGEGDILMGTLVGENGNTVIYMNIPKIDSGNENYTRYCGYQDGVNTIMNHLSVDYEFYINQVVDSEDNSTYEIKTPVVALHYPTRWKEKVELDISKDSVRFSNKNQILFEIMFYECDGYMIGTYNETPIYIKNYEVQSDEQKAMQEDVNVIIDNLKKDSNFAE